MNQVCGSSFSRVKSISLQALMPSEWGMLVYSDEMSMVRRL